LDGAFFRGGGCLDDGWGLTISIYTGNSFTNLIQVAGSGWGTYAEFRAEGGSDYVIRVDGASGTHRMSVDEFPAPTNDNFANRTVLVGSNLTVAGLAFGAGHEPGEPRDPFAAGTGSAWWSWRAPATGFLSLSVNAGFSAIWGVFLGESLTNLTPVFTGPGQAIRFRVVQGNTYQIGVDSQGWPMLNSSWSLDFGPGPMNDAFSHATALDGLTPVIRDIIANATIEPGEPVLDANPLAGSAWYVWTAPASGRVTLTTSDDSPACLMGVFTGSDVAHLSEVTLPASQKVVFGAEAGTSYRIMLETSDLTTNPVTLSLAFESSPGNDNFVHRSLLTGASATVTGSLFNATPEQGELELGIPLGSQSVWYAWTAPMSGLATVSASGDGWTPAVTAFTGASITNLALVQQDWGTIAFAVRAGTTYQLAVSSDENLAAPFTLTLNLEIPPTNDDFSNRAFLAGFKATGGGSFRAATGEPGEPAHEGGAATHSLWWTWIAPADGLARIYRDSPGDYGLATEQQAIYLGPELSNLTLVASSVTTNLVFQAVAGTAYQLAFNSDTPSSEPLAFRLELPQVIIVSPTNGQRWIESTDMLIEAQILDPNGTFRQVDFFVGSNLLASVTNAPFSVLCKKVPVGRYVLTARTTDESGDMSTSEAIEVTVLPGNDDFVNRFPLLTATLSVTGDIASASSEPSEPLLPSATGQTLWWSWSAPFSGVLTITSARSLFPSPLDHYPVIQEPDPPIFSPVLPPVGPNERRSGKSVVIIVFPPFHPPGPPDLLASGSSGGPGLAVYLGETLTSLTLLASDIYYYEGSWRVPPFPGWRAFPSLSFRVQAGQTYQIAVDGLNNSTGVAILDFDFVRDPLPPPNDNFATRFALAGSSVSGSGTTVSATREPGEPNHGVETDAAERTVWWSWSAPGSGTASLASELDSVGFAVYIGNSPASLLLIVSGQTQVTFEAKAGVEYQIVAFTAAEVQTDFSFSLQGPVPAPVVSGITFDAGSGGVSQVRVAGTTGQSFAVQASTNLVDWATVGVDTLQGAWSDFMDADAIRFPYRFYRLQPLESVLTPQILRVGFSPSPAASGCSLLISGPAGQPFRLRASADLAHWVDIYQGVIIGDGASFVDADARSFPARFYQIMPLP